MKTFTLHYSCILNASCEEVCSFHMDTHNLALITPPWIDVTIVSMDSPMCENSHVVLRIKRFGIPTVWKMKIAHLNCPNTVIDEMVKGPFPFFRHERIFSSLSEAQTQMEEHITLSLPFGFLGVLLFPLVKKDMDKMFAYRHQATQDYFLGIQHVLSL